MWNRDRVLSAVLAGLAVCGLLTAAVTPVAVASPTRAQSAETVAKQAARTFLTTSGCPLVLKKATSAGKVTSANRGEVVKRIVKQTLLPVGSGGACTSVSRAPKGAALERYKAAVRSVAKHGRRLVKLKWQDNTGGQRKTLAVMRKNGGRYQVEFDSLMNTYSRASAEQSPSAPRSADSGARGRQGTATGRPITWDPWSTQGGSVALAENGLGSTVVSKSVKIQIYVDQFGSIQDQTVLVEPHGSLFFDATKQVQVEQVMHGNVHCLKVTVTISWSNIFGGSRGTNTQVYTLCADGTTDYLSS